MYILGVQVDRARLATSTDFFNFLQTLQLFTSQLKELFEPLQKKGHN